MWVSAQPSGPDPHAGPLLGDNVIELGALGRVLLRQKRWVLGLPVLVAALTFVGVNLMTPRYKSEARLLIETRENVFLRPEAEKAGERDRGVVDQEAVTSQVQLALSRDLGRQVIRQLKLGERPEFDPVLRGINPIFQVFQAVGLMKDPLKMTPEERVFDSYYDRLVVFPVDKSRVVAVEFQSFDPELAARAANTVAENFLAVQQAAKQDETRAAGRWLGGEIEVLRQRLADAEAKVEGFRSKSNLFVGTNNTTLSNQQLGELNSQLAAARSQRADAESKARFIRETLQSGKSLDSADFLNSELIRRLSEQRATLRAQLAEQSSTLLDNHPRIKELKAQIADLERQVRLEGERLARSLENDARIAGSRVEALSLNLDQLKTQAANTNEQDIQLRALEREAKAQRDLLESYLAKYRETSARESLGAIPSDVRIISRAVVSNTPFFPKKLPTVLIAALATLFVMVGFVISTALMAANAHPIPAASEPADADERAEPRLLEAPLEHAPAPGEAVSSLHAIADLAAAIGGAGEAGRRIAVVGVARKVGTTPTALALARALGRQGRVVLVDLAFSHPSVAALAIERETAGIADLVRGAASFGAIIAQDKGSAIHVVPAGRLEADAATILASDRLDIALDAFARTYDHVVIDGGAAAEGLEPIARGARWAILVAGTAPPQGVTAARAQLAAAGFTEITVFEDPVTAVAAGGIHAAAA